MLFLMHGSLMLSMHDHVHDAGFVIKMSPVCGGSLVRMTSGVSAGHAVKMSLVKRGRLCESVITTAATAT